ncbi:Large exoprotein [Mycoavidus cysteinexigens]|uniref:Large exoprotein n=1 Tax=Mycoavidus cysteinexigens TaxID=1553431 RepID=A0A2Z6ETZ5_9BURK|nr:hypothetical protein [Mycoavidus cysteinexigens]BBE08878.1 Large exoprotein [Mycoavidus cysteinexigens]GAM52401.1 hemolysin [bacterium endosymbiont of Mortierella elongata FMR23-6]
MLRPINGISIQYIRTNSIAPNRPEQTTLSPNPEVDAPTTNSTQPNATGIAYAKHPNFNVVPRSLNSVIKIAGEPAQLIFSNVNGMDCCGYYFLHTSRLVLTTGEPVLNSDGEFQAFRLKTGEMTIQSKTTLKGYEQIDIIAYSIKIEGELYADTINLSTAREVNGSNIGLPITLQQPIPITSPETQPALLRQLHFTRTAKVQAKEHLTIQTDTLDNASSRIRSNGTVTLKANRLTGAGTLNAALDLSAKLEEDYTHKAQLNAGRHLSISTAKRLTNQGTLKTQGEIALEAKELKNQSKSLIDGVHLKLKVENSLKNYGVIQGSTVVIGAQHLINDGREDTDEQQAGAILGRKQLMIAARILYNQEHGLLHSGGDLTIGSAFDEQNAFKDLTKEFRNAAFSTVESRGKLLIKAIFLTNQKGQITAGSDLIFEGDTLTNSQGHIEAKGDQSVLKVRADIINNHSGYLIHSGAGFIQMVADMIVNHNAEAIKGAGLISSKGSIMLVVGKLSNHQGGTIFSDQTLKIKTFYTASLPCYLKNIAGTLSAHQRIEINTFRLDNSKGLIAVGKDEAFEPDISSDPDSVLEIRANAVINKEGGQIVQSGRGEIKIFSDASGNGYEAQEGLMSAQGRITIEAQNICHRHKSQMTGKDLNLVIGKRFVNQENSTVFASDRLSLRAQTLYNLQQGVLQSDRQLSVSVAKLNNLGTLHGKEQVRIQSESELDFTNSHPGLVVGEHILIGVPDQFNAHLTNDGGIFFAHNHLEIGIWQIRNREHGVLYSGGTLTMGGALDAQLKVQGLSGKVYNHGALIDASGDLTIHAHKLFNQNLRFEIEERLIEDRPMHVCIAHCQGEARYDGSQITWRGDVGGLYLVHPSGPEVFRFTDYHFTRRVTTTVVTNSEPGRIQAGGAIRLSDKVINDKSRIIAGGALSDLEGRPAQIENRDFIGQRVTTDRGTSQYSDRRWRGGFCRDWIRDWYGQCPPQPRPNGRASHSECRPLSTAYGSRAFSAFHRLSAEFFGFKS